MANPDQSLIKYVTWQSQRPSGLRFGYIRCCRSVEAGHVVMHVEISVETRADIHQACANHDSEDLTSGMVRKRLPQQPSTPCMSHPIGDADRHPPERQPREDCLSLRYIRRTGHSVDGERQLNRRCRAWNMHISYQCQRFSYYGWICYHNYNVYPRRHPPPAPIDRGKFDRW